MNSPCATHKLAGVLEHGTLEKGRLLAQELVLDEVNQTLAQGLALAQEFAMADHGWPCPKIGRPWPAMANVWPTMAGHGES